MVREDLAEAVQRAAEELDYTLDRTARSLRRRSSDVLALVVPDIENPFFTAVARGVEDVAREAGLSLVLCNSDDDPAKEARYLEIVAQEGMAGIILAPASHRPLLGPLQRKGRTVIVIDRVVRDEVDQVVFDNVALGLAGARQLVERGARRIACITGPDRIRTAHDRAAGWARALTESGLEPEPELVQHVNYRVDGGRTAMQALLRLAAPPDAVLATNNMVGIGTLQVLAGLPVDQRPAVAVIGDLPYVASESTDVLLLPLRPRELGMQAAQMFVERRDGLDVPARRVIMAETTPQRLAAGVPTAVTA